MLKINLVCGCESITFLCFIMVEQQAKYQCMMVYRYILKWTNNYWYHLFDDYIYIVYKLQIAITDESLNSCLGFLPLLFSVLYFNWEDIIQIRVQINRIPLLSVTLPIKVTIWGNQSVFFIYVSFGFFFFSLLIQPIFKISLLNSPEKSNSPKPELTSSGIFLSLPVRSGWKLLYNSLLSSIHLFSLVLNKNCKPIQISLGIWGSKDVIKSVGQNRKCTFCGSDSSSKHLKNTLH